ncbi:cytochrome C oxidase subunit IV family protein [Novosphingobium sp. BL-8A]|uniref:cytochrome C oxidase subunit IV family protein n=1 Tax=Novosphingobium sp. BL-8A TaxID=3127639 RepID=UPI003756CDD2
MPLSLPNRLLLCWFVLTAITLLAWWIGAHHGKGPLKPDAAVAFGVMAIALIKVRVILREFMDVRHASARLRWITDSWLISFAAMMAAAYLI